ncbi:NAD(P)H-dependent D-xylose reductase (XR) [Chytridiales sp. JEL 0842]|nr:NAD(P)H-dependent D-xylose reductase (XR) [Chytridiales sp. JEL 0842]
MSLPRTFKLSSGHIAPSFGLGTWRAAPNEVGAAVRAALDKYNYLHIDCAAIYENEKEIGQVFTDLFKRSSNPIDRSKIFITSKLWNTNQHPADVPVACAQTLSDLELDYLDLYLIHWPLPAVKNGGKDASGKLALRTDFTLEDTWRAMEKLVDEGKVKSIGVSNFTIKKLKEVLSFARIKPAVNQVELHPYLPQHDLLSFCKANDIMVTAYSPLGSGQEPSPLKDKLIVELAKKYNKTPAQVLISWGLQRGTQVIPKSSKEERVKENAEHFVLEAEDFEKLNNLYKTTSKRFVDPKDFWGHDIFAEGQ